MSYFLLAFAFSALAYIAQEQYSIRIPNHDLADRIMQAAYGLYFYPSKTLFPAALSPLYLLRHDYNPFAAQYIFCAVAILLISIVFILLRRRWPGVLTAWICYAIIVSPVLGLAQSGYQITADRYSYFACLPFSVLLAGGVLKLLLADRVQVLPLRVKYALLGLLFLGFVFLGYLTARQTRIWHDGFSLWGHAIDLDPQNGYAYYSRGYLYEVTGRFQEAVADYDKALATFPGYPISFNNLANLRYKYTDDPEGALRDYTTSIEQEANNPTAYCNRGAIRRKLGDLEGALSDYNTALQFDPKYSAAYNNRGNLLRTNGRLEEARADFDAAVRLNPEYEEALFNRGLLGMETGDWQAAFADFSKAIELNPRSARTFFNRGLARRNARNYRGALEDYRRALAVAPADWPERPKVTRHIETVQSLLKQGTSLRP